MDRQTYRPTDRQTNIQAHRQKDRQTDSSKEMQVRLTRQTVGVPTEIQRLGLWDLWLRWRRIVQDQLFHTAKIGRLIPDKGFVQLLCRGLAGCVQQLHKRSTAGQCASHVHQLHHSEEQRQQVQLTV